MIWSSAAVGDDRIDIPEEIQTQMADEIEPEADIERDLDVLQRLDPNFINDPGQALSARNC